MSHKTQTRRETRSFEQATETRAFEKGKLELVSVGGRTIGRATFEPGWKWSTCIGPIAKTKRCEAEHVGYQLTGTMRVAGDDGEYDIHAGEAFYIPPGHDGWVVGDETVVVLDFQGMTEYAKSQEKPRRERRH